MKWLVCMESNNEGMPFQKPNRLWLIYLFPASLVLLLISVILFLNVQAGTSSQAKYYFLLFFGLFLISLYLNIAYFYQVWVTPKKNLLYQLSEQINEPITYIKSKSVVLDVYKLEESGINTRQFSKLSQKDLKDIHTACTKREQTRRRI